MSEQPTVYRLGTLEVPTHLLRGLLDHKAATGEMFTVEEARLDAETRPDDTERERAERWAWTRYQVRKLMQTGDASPKKPSTSVNQESTKINQESATEAPSGQEVNQESTKINQGSTSESGGSHVIEGVYPPSPTGTAPQGATNEPASPPVEDQIRLMQAEAERIGAERQKLEAAAQAAEAERKRLAAERRRGKSRFEPPTVDEVRAYGSEKAEDDPRYGPQHAEDFVGHFTTNGWKVGRGGLPMKDWRAAYLGWCRRAPQFAQSSGNAKPLDLTQPLSFEQKARAIAERGLAESDFYGKGLDWKGDPQFMLRPEKRAELNLETA